MEDLKNHIVNLPFKAKLTKSNKQTLAKLFY